MKHHAILIAAVLLVGAAGALAALWAREPEPAEGEIVQGLGGPEARRAASASRPATDRKVELSVVPGK